MMLALRIKENNQGIWAGSKSRKGKEMDAPMEIALESRRVSLGAHWVDSRESSLLRRLERGREIGR